jgi:hypothetical protein
MMDDVMPWYAIVCLLCAEVLPAGASPARCLPTGIELSDVVSPRLTVEAKLIELQARCEDSRLVDGDGKEIRFYRLIGCWGNPPADYREILARQRTELEGLKARYTVIEMTCGRGRDIRRIN